CARSDDEPGRKRSNHNWRSGAMSVLNPFKLRSRKEVPGGISIQGSAKRGSARSRSRIFMAMGVVFAIYGTIGARLVHLGLIREPVVHRPPRRRTAPRPDILAAYGGVLATATKTASLFAEPGRIADIGGGIEKLHTVLPDLDYTQTFLKLDSDA